MQNLSLQYDRVKSFYSTIKVKGVILRRRLIGELANWRRLPASTIRGSFVPTNDWYTDHGWYIFSREQEGDIKNTRKR